MKQKVCFGKLRITTYGIYFALKLISMVWKVALLMMVKINCDLLLMMVKTKTIQ